MSTVVTSAHFDALESYFFADEFVESFEKWAAPHAALFGPDASTSGEQKLEFHEIYRGFTALYEEKLETFVKEQGLEMGAFMEACKAELLKGQGSDDWSERSPHAFILRVIAATAEYDSFLQIMAEVAQRTEEATAKPEA